jgi:pyridoxamine 5'-phosphate oxidase
MFSSPAMARSARRRTRASSDSPIERFARWMAAAERRGLRLPEATVVATSDRRGRPSARFVLLKRADERGFVFFTDARSRKGRELRGNPRAALVCYWHTPGRQVRVEGKVEPVSPAETDAYWVTRPRESRLAAASSKQSAPLERRRELIARVERLRLRLAGRPVPRPRYWMGFRVVPERIEFWSLRAHRLHERELFVRRGAGWARILLQP